MINNRARKSWISYVTMSVLFFLTVVFNEYIDVAGVRPDLLLIMLIFLASREKPIIAICCAFAFGFLQDVFLPGIVQYWGLSPLLKTLLIFSFIKLYPLIGRLRGPVYHLSIFGSILVYYLFYNMLYYSGYMKPFMIFYRYSFPEAIYTFLIYLLLNMIFPAEDQAR